MRHAVAVKAVRSVCVAKHSWMGYGGGLLASRGGQSAHLDESDDSVNQC